ncbi:MAG TPA: glycosyltransferase [Coleofasciculaceae cyanobacterium]|jgi:glycosyltransferase involved in cell wall biosynthesis
MKSSLLVSIIINNYNYDRFLAEAIDSALNQSYTDIEVIVVDDGSTDNSRQIISEYGDRIIAILQPNGKQAAAFNSGFAKSKGEIVIFLDSDDFLFSQAVAEIVAIWQPNLAKVHYRLNVVDGAGKSLGYSSPQGSSPLSRGKVWQMLLETGGYNSTPTSGNALSRQALTNLFPIPEQYKLTADDYLSFQVPFYGEVAAIERPLGVYRVHDSNQWALATVTGDRFKRFVCHDLQNFSLLTKKAQELGYQIPPDLEQRSIGRLWSRIISLRLNIQTHPVKGDRSTKLIYQGIRSLWKYSDFNLPKRIFYSLWFIWVGLMPLPLAKPAISWLYAPQHRPKLVSWTTNQLRTLIS